MLVIKLLPVVMSQAFEYIHFPVDTHIHRLAYRWGLSSGKNVEQTEKRFKTSISEDLWNKLLANHLLWRKYCPAGTTKIMISCLSRVGFVRYNLKIL